MELRQLRHFVAVVEAGNLSRAAGRVFISQPALTRSIKNLEDQLGVLLLERKPRGVVPTEAGDSFYRHARLILNECQRAKSEVAEIESGNRGAISIGIAALFAGYVLDGAVAAFIDRYPKASITVHQGFFEDLLDRLREGELDLVFSNFPSVPAEDGLEVEPLRRIASHIVAARDHPLAGKGAATKEELAQQRWVTVNQPHMTEQLDSYFASDSLPRPAVAVRTNSLTLIRSLLLRGELIGFLPDHLIDNPLFTERLAKIEAQGTPLLRRAGLIYRREVLARPAIQAMVDTIRRVCGEPPILHPRAAAE